MQQFPFPKSFCRSPLSYSNSGCFQWMIFKFTGRSGNDKTVTRVPGQFFFHINRIVKSVEGSRIQDELHKISGRIYLGPHTLRHAFSIIPHLKGVDVYQIMKGLAMCSFSL